MCELVKGGDKIIRDACEIGGAMDSLAHSEDAECVVDKISMQQGGEIAAVRRLVESYIRHNTTERRRGT